MGSHDSLGRLVCGGVRWAAVMRESVATMSGEAWPILGAVKRKFVAKDKSTEIAI